jgi:hypothetical protein
VPLQADVMAAGDSPRPPPQLRPDRNVQFSQIRVTSVLSEE